MEQGGRVVWVLALIWGVVLLLVPVDARFPYSGSCGMPVARLADPRPLGEDPDASSYCETIALQRVVQAVLVCGTVGLLGWAASRQARSVRVQAEEAFERRHRDQIDHLRQIIFELRAVRDAQDASTPPSS